MVSCNGQEHLEGDDNGASNIFLPKASFGIPPSLEEAIDAFLLTCAARAARGQEREHNSMLVHVSRFVDVHDEVQHQNAAVDQKKNLHCPAKVDGGTMTIKNTTISGEIEHVGAP